MKSPILPRHPLDNPRTVKIALGSYASDALANLDPLPRHRHQGRQHRPGGRARADDPALHADHQGTL